MPFCYFDREWIGEHLGYSKSDIDNLKLKNQAQNKTIERKLKSNRLLKAKYTKYCNLADYIFTDEGICYSINAIPLTQKYREDLYYIQLFKKIFLSQYSDTKKILYPAGNGDPNRLTFIIDLHNYRAKFTNYGWLEDNLDLHYRLHVHDPNGVPG